MVPADFVSYYCIKVQNFYFLGENTNGNIDTRKCFYDLIKNNFWFPSNILTQDIKYGVESESLAVNLYMSNNGNKVVSSGL